MELRCFQKSQFIFVWFPVVNKKVRRRVMGIHKLSSLYAFMSKCIQRFLAKIIDKTNVRATLLSTIILEMFGILCAPMHSAALRKYFFRPRINLSKCFQNPFSYLSRFKTLKLDLLNKAFFVFSQVQIYKNCFIVLLTFEYISTKQQKYIKTDKHDLAQ